MIATSVVGEVSFGTYIAANFASREEYGCDGFVALKGQIVDAVILIFEKI
jgi:hypothetical protein